MLVPLLLTRAYLYRIYEHRSVERKLYFLPFMIIRVTSIYQTNAYEGLYLTILSHPVNCTKPELHRRLIYYSEIYSIINEQLKIQSQDGNICMYEDAHFRGMKNKCDSNLCSWLGKKLITCLDEMEHTRYSRVRVQWNNPRTCEKVREKWES